MSTEHVMQRRTHVMCEYIVLGFLVFCVRDVCYGDNKTYVYVRENETVTLTCNPNVHVWWGPINFTVFASGGKISPNVPQYRRLSLNYNQDTHFSELQIQNFSKEDEGVYRCSFDENGIYAITEETVLIKKNPKNITILGTDKKLFAQINQLLDLTCYVESGIPKEIIIWSSNNNELARGGPSSLTYIFTPILKDHMRNFSCLVRTDSIALEKSVTLFLYFPPTVQILPGHFVSVVEGTNVRLECNYTSYHKIKEMIWQHDNISMTNSSQLHLVSIKRNQSGEYSCTVVNEAGAAAENVTIEVLYPPDVTVSFFENRGTRQLKCSPAGFPNRYYFGKWEHISEFREHIRFLPSNKNGIISIPYTKNETDRHHDRGIYICKVSNNVSKNGRTLMSAEYWHNSTGKPYFVSSNNATQYSIVYQNTVVTTDIVTFETLTNAALFAVNMKKSNYSSIKQSPVTVKDTMYDSKVTVHATRVMFLITIKSADEFRQYTVVVNNTKGSSSYDIWLRSAKPLKAPQNLKAVALDTRILVKWTAGEDIGLKETFIVEYRKHFDSLWNRVSSNDRSTAILNELHPNEVYFLRVYSKTAAGESNKTDVIIVKTEKPLAKVTISTTESTLVFGAGFIMIIVFWCGTKVLKNRKWFSRDSDRAPSSSRNMETSVRIAQYDEIDSIYYNPLNNTASPQNTRNGPLLEIPHSSTRHACADNCNTNNVPNKNITPGIIQHINNSLENISLRSSSDESYLVPCRKYLDLDSKKVTEGEQPVISVASSDESYLVPCSNNNNLDIGEVTENEHQVTSINDSNSEIDIEESSVSSDNSNTNIKSLRKYEKLRLSDINAQSNTLHMYNYIDT